MTRSAELLWSKLAMAGIVVGDQPEQASLESPWYVKLLMAFFGWLAAVFLIGFIGAGLAFVIDSTPASLIAGAAMIVGAFFILRSRKKEFFEHFALAISLAGQVLLLWSLNDNNAFGSTQFWVIAALLQMLLALVIPDFVHRVFSAFSASVALHLAFASQTMHFLIPGILLFGCVWLWLSEYRFPAHIQRIQAIGYGLVLALIPFKGSLLFPYGNLFWYEFQGRSTISLPWWLGELVLSLALVFLVWQLSIRYRELMSQKMLVAVSLATIILVALSFEVPGISMAIAILLLGFAGSNPVLQGLGIVSLLFNASAYYYLLETTLLFKAWILLSLGLVLLVSRWLISRVFPENKEKSHAG